MQIATYGDQQVETQVVRHPEASTLPPEAFQGIGPAVVAVAKAVGEVKQRADQAQAEDVLQQFEQAKNDLLFSPKTGYFNSRGRDAYDQADATSKGLDDLARTFADKVNDPRARDAFLKVANQHLTDAKRGIMQHSSQGVNEWETANIKAQVEGSLQNAPLYRNDPKQLAIQYQLGEDAVVASLQRQGISDPDVQKQHVDEYRSAFHTAAISAAIHDGVESGIAAMNKYGQPGMILEKDRIKLEDELKRKDKEQTSETQANISIAAGRGIADTYYNRGGLAAARAEVDKQFPDDPVMNKRVMSEVQSEFALRDHIKQRSQSDALDAAEAYLLGAKPGESRTVNDFIAQNPGAWNTLDDKTKRKLEAGVLTVTDQSTLMDIRSMTQDQLATLDVTKVMDRLSAEDRKGVWKMVEDARAGKHDIQLQSDSEYIRAKAKEYGLNDKQKEAAFVAVQGELNKAVALKGELSKRDRQKIITDSLAPFAVEGRSWFGLGTKTYSMKDTPIPTLHALNAVEAAIKDENPGADFPQLRGQLSDIVTALDKAGTPVNSGTLMAEYRKLYEKNKPLPPIPAGATNMAGGKITTRTE